MENPSNGEMFMKFDIIIAGGSLGGVRAAISAAKSGRSVLLIEETDWVGGQLTSQAVPPDEHRWIESQGATASYRAYRERVRAYYRNQKNATDAIRNAKNFCPGGSWVSRVAHSPALAHKILSDELRPYIEKGLLTLLIQSVVCDAVTEGDSIKCVTVKNLKDGTESVFEGKFFLDATDCGDLLPLVGAEYRMGAESKSETGEPHAAEVACREDMQPVTWVFALKLKESLDDKDLIPKPAFYEEYKSKKTHYGDLPLFGWETPDAQTKKPLRYAMFDGEVKPGSLGMWSYRRIVCASHYTDKVEEVSLINWAQNDYDGGIVYGSADKDKHLEEAKRQSLCFAYWLQNEAPNAQGGKGYPVALCGEVVGTEDGFAKAVYIRESRRIVGKQTIVEQDVSRACNSGIKRYAHSVGVGHYSIDVHQTTVTHSTCFAPTYPFEIPLGAMIPVRLKNLLPACKNISCTHLTNGCYRLHPVEWNVGEVAGLLAAYCLEKDCTPEDVEKYHYDEFEKILLGNGIQLHWKEEEMQL